MNQTQNLHTSLIHQQGYIGQRPALPITQGENQLLAHALDEIACGIIIVSDQGCLQHANLAGKTILKQMKWLRQRDRHITTLETQDATPYKDALAKAQQGKRSILNLGSSHPITVAVVPLGRPCHSTHWIDNFAAQSLCQQSQSPGEIRVALIFSRSGMCETLMLSFFARAYQLTRAEEQILGLLCVGHTAPEMAKQLSVGQATVRTHIRNICAKTNSHGIREITKRLALLPPLMAAVMPAAFS